MRANRFVLEALAQRGHVCYSISPATPASSSNLTEYRELLNRRGIQTEEDDDNGLRFNLNGVTVLALAGSLFRTKAPALLKTLSPDWVVVSSEDLFFTSLQSVIEAKTSRVCYLTWTTLFLPFGPDSFRQNIRGASLIRRAHTVLACSRYLQDYLKKWGDISASLLKAPVYGSGPFVRYGRFSSQTVLMVNPCALKGISIFLALADEFPDVSFRAVPTWATTEQDLELLHSRPNIELLQPVDEIGDLLKNTGILLAPSLCAEGFGMIAVDAMLRGIPVIASDYGGLKEAKLGVDYSIPVNPIIEYTDKFDSRMLPIPVVPSQNLQPWKAALQRLLADQSHYEHLATRSFDAAAKYFSSLKIESFEQAL